MIHLLGTPQLNGTNKFSQFYSRIKCLIKLIGTEKMTFKVEQLRRDDSYLIYLASDA